jgi:hypothetical protein
MLDTKKVIDLSMSKERDVVNVCDRKATVCLSKNNRKYLASVFHKTTDDKLYCRAMFTDVFAEYQAKIYEKYNVLVLDIDELIVFFASKSDCALEVKADVSVDKIAQTINLYFKQLLSEAQIVEKMRVAKISDEIIAKYFPNTFKTELAF